ncbi:T9SS type A sorting domain-containing protein [Botryobacter ruber]|uniref:T9SS type A sorting domain-containing protein n=1 Tax=Botryobacter ruber TaxID=2171629 RepID=UPI0013E3FCB5|nr:T9SS type A sorting domain-containing protein [Botryobacter ruber]
MTYRVNLTKTWLLALLLCCLWLPVLCQAQTPIQFRLRHDIPVTTSAGTLAAPWSGGLNAPQFSTIDLNQDGQDDLFIFDRMARKVFTYLAVQENGAWRYQYAPQYEVLFPAELEAWVLLRDFNCDGLKDIFTSSPLGIKVYRQVPGNQVAFELAEEALFYRGRSGNNSNMQMLATDIPAIVDMDGDGDLDILLQEFSPGERLEYYKNLRVEENLPCQILKFVQETNWWGGITECEACEQLNERVVCQDCNYYLFNEQCPPSLLMQRLAAPLHTSHEGSALLAIDLDGDGDKDLLVGNVGCSNLIKMENQGTRTNAVMTGFDATFPSGTTPAAIGRFPAAYYEDVTFDGIPDLLVSSNNTLNEDNDQLQRNVWLYRNKGTAEQPVFEFVQEDFLQGHMLDFGEGAYPAFADIDGDGKLDMLAGNYAAVVNGKHTSSLSYFRNTGTATAPAFTLATADFLGLAANEFLHIKPVFADINHDGAADLVLTYRLKQNNTTRISYIPNTAAKGQPMQLDFASQQLLLNTTDGDAPCFTDADGDGKLDMLLGKAGGALAYYRNTGSAQAPAFTPVTNSFGGIAFDFRQRNLYPATADLDGNGDPDLLTVDETGTLKVYRNFTDNLTGKFIPETMLLENPLLEEAQQTRFGRGLGITVAGLGGGPGNLYVVVGSQAGGLYLLEQTSGNNYNPTEQAGLQLEVYPNPAGSTLQGLVKVRASEPVAITIYDTIGRAVYLAPDTYNRNHTISLKGFNAGVYLVRATSSNGQHETIKLVVE